MSNVGSLSDGDAGTSLRERRKREAERKERVFNDKVRTVGVDREALDTQVEEKKKQEEAEKGKQNAYDADLLHNSKVACILHSREVKKKRAMEKTIVDYRHQHQLRHDQNSLDRCGETDHDRAQMMLPGLLGEDSGSKDRLQRQKEQLREWLIQQQSERAEERRLQKLEEQRYDQSRIELDNKALQLQSLDMERRKAEVIAIKEYNLAKTEEKRRHVQECNDENKKADTKNQLQGEQTGLDVKPPLGMVGVAGLCHSSDRRAPPESLQQVIRFQKYQIEEKKRTELEKKQEEALHDRVRLDSARTALLIERQQAKLNKQLRRHLDSTNIKMAEIQKQQKPDIERGCIDESFFSKFNTCSR